MEFKLNLHHRNVTDEDLIADLLEVKTKLNKKKITCREYNNYGKYSSNTFSNRFGTWNKALQRAGITLSMEINISGERLFKNLEEVWIKLGRQPTFLELKQPLSKFHGTTYQNRFGSWNEALEKFVDYINTETVEDQSNDLIEVKDDNIKRDEIIHKTKREITFRLRFRILMRDGFTCRSCGKSPQNERGVELHVDHILPWSKGGETVPENLETKCKKCNLGKGNAFNV